MQNFWRKYRSCDKVFNVIFTALMLVLIIAGLFAFYNLKTTGTGFVFGYQPVYIQTGSMEPAINTGAIILTKEVKSMDEIAIDDIITYEVYDATGKPIRITHRIYNIIEDRIITKGDNNRVADTYELTIDNVRAKVVLIWNGAAKIQVMWGTTAGKILICSIAAFIILGFYLLSKLGETLDEKYGICRDEEGSISDVISAANNQEYEYEYEDDEEEPIAVPIIPEIPEVKSWSDIYNFKVSEDNKVTITGLKNGFSALTEITVPEKIKHKPVVGIGPFVFKNCKVNIVNLPNTLEIIDKAAFYKCEDLIYVKIPQTVNVIGANAFDGCKELIDIELPVNLTRIEDKTFNGCVGLSSIKINDKVTFIGDSAFYGCNNLTTIYGAKSVIAIKLNAFKVTTPDVVETNLVTENEYMLNYNWNSFGRTCEAINSQELLDDIQAENDKFYDELKQIEDYKATHKDMPEKIYEAVKNAKIPSLPKKKAKKEEQKIEPKELEKLDTSNPELGSVEKVEPMENLEQEDKE